MQMITQKETPWEGARGFRVSRLLGGLSGVGLEEQP